jgi:hypothetical protein
MRDFSKITGSMLLSVAIAIALSWLPHIQRQNEKSAIDLAAFHSTTAMRLTGNNLVDGMASLPLSLEIRKVELDSSILTVDLTLKDNPHAEESVIRDFYEIARFGLSRSSNVQQVLVRVLETKAGKKVSGDSVLASLDARRETRDVQMVMRGEESTEAMGGYLKTHFRVTFTQRWKTQYSRPG